ncbi:hypothetical protein IMSAGC019_02107 [Lachnospiraceae bacterium]|nr:hypothetical protein IMSAGC019_02107 [Lachnospiraceae bacterium]
MVIKRDIYQPLILTIPDDTALFSILDPEEEITKKIVMENYINFYSFRDPQYGNVVFRFENFMDYESIVGLERCFIPIDIMKKYYDDLDIIIKLLTEGYGITMPVARSCISFYGNDAEGNHLLFIYGADTERRNFFCKDFSGGKFVEFEVPFDAVKNSLAVYYRPFAKESDGLLAFRINKKISPQIDYTKVYCEFHKLDQEYYSDEAGYGIGAVNMVLNDIKKRPFAYAAAGSWFNVCYFLLEASKLFNLRYKIFTNEPGLKQDKEVGSAGADINKLFKDTNLLFLTVYRLHLKKINVLEDVFKELVTLLCICRDDLRVVVKYFCGAILEL